MGARYLIVRAVVVLCAAMMLVLTAATLTDAGAPNSGRSPATAPTDKTTCKSQVAPCPRVIAGKVRSRTIRKNVRRTISGHRVQRHANRDSAFLRRLLLARSSSLMREQRLRLLDGWQIRLIDGDTFAYGAERIRIMGINTPEVSESGGFEASQRLDLLLREGPVTIIPQAVDKYGRTVADVFVNNQNVADVLRREGYARSR